MARKSRWDLNFEGFLDLSRELSEKYGNEALLKATSKALDESRNFVNTEVEKAMNSSKYHFDGTGYSKGKAKKSLDEIKTMPVEINGTIVKVKAGVDLSKAPEVIILGSGTPHLKKDAKLNNAIRVKGKIRKEVDRIQKEVFVRALMEGNNND